MGNARHHCHHLHDHHHHRHYMFQVQGKPHQHKYHVQVSLNLLAQPKPTETTPILTIWWTHNPSIYVNKHKDSDSGKPKSMYQTFLHIFVVQKSMHLGVSANQNRCTGGYQQTKIDAPKGIGRPKSMHQTGSGALTFWTFEIFWHQVH